MPVFAAELLQASRSTTEMSAQLDDGDQSWMLVSSALVQVGGQRPARFSFELETAHQLKAPAT